MHTVPRVDTHAHIRHVLGYAGLIRAYVQYLKSKIAFHHSRPQFTGKFDYKEYIAQRGMSNLDDK